MFKTYYQLAKPGIVYGNALTVIAGLFLASKGHIHLKVFLVTLIGISLIVAGACVYNNYLDREIDKKMARTKKRALAIGSVATLNALTYATILELIGFYCLAYYTNLLTVILAAVGLIDYVVLYGITKRRSVHGTVVGSISGAIPLVVGYTAIADHFGIEALLLLLIMAFWQMPHFYGIAMYRVKDYEAAGIPVLPLKKGMTVTKIQSLCYIVAFLLANILLSLLGYTGYIYVLVMTLASLGWLWLGLTGYKTKTDSRWGQTMFLYSLIVILVLSIMLSIGSVVF